MLLFLKERIAYQQADHKGECPVPTDTKTGLIPGHTAYAVTKWRYRTTTALVGVCVVSLCLMRAGVPQSWFTDTLVAMMAVCAFALIVLVWWADARSGAEKRAGYTTIRLGDKQLLQRDPYMGRTIRLAGAEFLSRKEFGIILAATNAEASRKSVLSR